MFASGWRCPYRKLGIEIWGEGAEGGLRSSAGVTMEEYDGTQNHAQAVSSNSCNNADPKVNNAADPDCGNNAYQDRYQDRKTKRDVIDDVVGFVLHSQERKIQG
jgi:hypothetical protein